LLTTGWIDKLCYRQPLYRQNHPHTLPQFGNPLTSHRILFATDLPFWRRSTGAEQRIARLVEYLSQSGYCVRIFLLCETTELNQDNSIITEKDQQTIRAQNLDIEFKRSSHPPRQLSKKAAWHLKAIKHHFGSNQTQQHQTSPAQPASQNESLETATPTTLADYRWPWAIDAFADSIRSFAPDSVIIEYVKLSYLLEALTASQRKKTHCLLDTHDVLHLRNKQFQERGLVHWLDISQEEETQAVQLFDTILAIQNEEADVFRNLAPKQNVLVCGHAPLQLPPLKIQPTTSEILTVGYIASANASNLQSLTNFIDQSWKPISQRCKIRLVIAGMICDAISTSSPDLFKEHSNIARLGCVSELADFYHQIDVAINPVAFGTGLKIKNCEAIFFGKPLVTTTIGMDGFSAESSESLMVCNSPEDWVDCLVEIAQNPSRQTSLQQAAAKLSQTGFSDQEVYSELDNALRHKK